MRPYWIPIIKIAGRNKISGGFLRGRAIIIFLLIAVAIAIGTIGYMLLEGWSLIEAFYMTMITITTVGFGEIRPLSPTGRIFTVVLILGGIGIVTYTTTSVVQYLLSGELRTELISHRRRRMLSRLDNHYIVCGYGRVGRHVVAELARKKTPFVIIDNNETVVEECRQAGYNIIQGNASDDEVLEQAGIYRAKSLITAVNSDAENVFIVLTARSLCPELVIVSRANFDEAEPKLLRAGATQVISPYAISGRRMVSSVDHPELVDYLDIVMHSPEMELWLEDVIIADGSELENRSLHEAHLRSRIGVNVLSMRLPGKPLMVQPDIEIPLVAGTHLIVLGNREQLEQLGRLIEPALASKQPASSKQVSGS